MTRYAIWCEGYRVTGNEGHATYFGISEGDSFKNACINYFDKPEHKQYFNPDSMTYWGCRLFDNQADASERFG